MRKIPQVLLWLSFCWLLGFNSYGQAHIQVVEGIIDRQPVAGQVEVVWSAAKEVEKRKIADAPITYEFDFRYYSAEKEQPISLFLSKFRLNTTADNANVTSCLALQSKWLDLPPGLELRSSNKEFCLPGGLEENGIFRFKIPSEGVLDFSIPYTILADGGAINTATPSRSIPLRLVIKNFPSQQEETWNACVNPKPTQACLKDYLMNYPKGSYVNEANEYLAILAQLSEQESQNSQVETKPNQATPPKPKPKPVSSPASEDWVATKKLHTVVAYQDFITKWEDKGATEEQILEAREALVLLSPMRRGTVDELPGDNHFRVGILNAIAPGVVAISDSSLAVVTDNQLLSDYFLDVQLLENKRVEIDICDANKPDSVRCFTLLVSPNIFIVNGQRDSVSNGFRLTFKGGETPYYIYLRKGEGSPPRLVKETADSIAHLNWEEITRTLERRYGPYEVVVLSSDAPDLLVPFADNKGNYLPEPLPNWVYYSIGGLLFLLLVRFGYKSRKRKRLRALMEKRQQEEEEQLQHEQREKETGVKSDDEGSQKASPKIVIKAKETVAFVAPEVGNGEYERLALGTIWSDTVVEYVHLHQRSISAISEFLNEQQREFREEEGLLPEIGGFLIGQAWKAANSDTYQVTVEHFVPVSPEFNDAHILEFSSKAIADELGGALETYDPMVVVGWFHTHPGHGLFLSSSDLAVQEGFFIKPFHLAMEIESKTPYLDTAFFSWQKSGKINNSTAFGDTRKADVGWFQWRDLESK